MGNCLKCFVLNNKIKIWIKFCIHQNEVFKENAETSTSQNLVNQFEPL